MYQVQHTTAGLFHFLCHRKYPSILMKNDDIGCPTQASQLINEIF